MVEEFEYIQFRFSLQPCNGSLPNFIYKCATSGMLKPPYKLYDSSLKNSGTSDNTLLRHFFFRIHFNVNVRNQCLNKMNNTIVFL